METIRNWRGEGIEVAQSRGGVKAVVDPFGGLLKGGVRPWPPPELVQKLYRSNQIRAFSSQSHDALVKRLGFYTDLQSLHSEDAITWSVFGIIAYANTQAKRDFVKELFEIIKVPTGSLDSVTIWLWRRLPHPDTLVSGGPEVDFGIQTDDTVILGEAKWLSPLGQAQGIARNNNQLALRAEFIRRYGRTVYPNASTYVVLAVSIQMGLLQSFGDRVTGTMPYLREATWETICSMSSHPFSDELGRYFEWKVGNSRAALPDSR
jgi:hypothetical protein